MTTDKREELATRYFDDHLSKQRDWYDGKASRNKAWHLWLGFTILAAGATTSVIQVWAPPPLDQPVGWVAIMSALLGAVVIIAKGVERIWDFDDTWVGYRRASEAMNRERRLFLNGADVYRGIPDDQEAYLFFVERVEEIIALEQSAYWQRREGVAEKSEGADS